MIGVLTKKQNIEQKKAHKLFAVVMCLFVAMFFARNVFSIQFPVALYLGAVAGIAIVCSREELIALVVSFIPLSVGFQYKYAILLCIAIYIFKYAKTIRFPKYALVVVAMFVWELLHAFVGELSLVESLRDFSELIFLAIVLMAEDFNFSDGLVERTLAYCTFAAVSIVFLVSLRDIRYDLVEFLESGIRFGLADTEAVNFGFNYNQNGLGLLCNMGIAAILLLRHNKQAKLWDYAVIATLFFIGLMTISRSFIICFVLIIVLYVFTQTGSLKKKMTSLLGMAALLVALVLIASVVMPQAFSNLEARFMVEDVTNGRNDLFAFYNKHILSDWKHLIFGVGLQNYADKVGRIHNVFTNVSHNSIQEAVVVWGIVGVVLLGYLVYFIIKRARCSVKKVLIVNYIPLILLFVQSLSGQLLSAGKELLIFTFIYACFCNSGNREDIQK